MKAEMRQGKRKISVEEVPDSTDFATHHLSLTEAAHAYDIFQKKEDGAIKIILKP